MKKTIRLTENEFKHFISESVKTILKEYDWDSNYESYYASSERDNPMSPNYKPLECVVRVDITTPIYMFVKSNFDWDTADDFQAYLEMDDDCYKPYAKIYEYYIQEFTDYDAIINHIKGYDNPKVAQAVINSFDSLVYDYEYDKEDLTWDEE